MKRLFDRPSDRPWRPILALALIWFGTLSGWQWIWGVLFLIWTLPALANRRIHLIDAVERDRHPILYWAILATWIVLSLALLALDIALLAGWDVRGGLS